MKALWAVLGFVALFLCAVVGEWFTTPDRKGFWLGPLGILAEILSCFFRPF